jgi:MFS superfamily sulfate permease-like transporter
MKLDKETLLHDFLSSIVVFFVALPLCMGIALASGVPPALGLISGIIGGLIVGAFAGSPLQVSGPAAGLAVMVFDLVGEYGVSSLIPLGIVVGIVQMTASYFKLGLFFRATSPSLIKGLLGGIGVLIFCQPIPRHVG